MPLLFDHLGGQVLGGAAHGEGVLIANDVILGEAEVRELDIAGRIDQNIFWFQTAIKKRSTRGR